MGLDSLLVRSLMGLGAADSKLTGPTGLFSAGKLGCKWLGVGELSSETNAVFG